MSYRIFTAKEAAEKVRGYLLKLWRMQGPEAVTLEDLRVELNNAFNMDDFFVPCVDTFLADALKELLKTKYIILNGMDTLSCATQTEWSWPIAPGASVLVPLFHENTPRRKPGDAVSPSIFNTVSVLP